MTKQCDQAKPTCQRCKKKQVSCLYLQPHGGNLPSHYIKDLQALASSGRPLWPGRRSPSTVTEPAPHQKALSPQSTLDLRLLQHFDTFTSGDTVGPQVRKIFQGPILDLALEVGCFAKPCPSKSATARYTNQEIATIPHACHTSCISFAHPPARAARARAPLGRS